MIDSIINTKKINEAEVVIVSAGYEKTTSSRKGTVDGPKAVIKMLDSKLELFDRTYKMQPADLVKIGQKDLGNITSLSPEKVLNKTICAVPNGKILASKNMFARKSSLLK
ncbi:MAG: hypothetical protein AAB444_00825 [Patescibacteria group bacterium]